MKDQKRFLRRETPLTPAGTYTAPRRCRLLGVRVFPSSGTPVPDDHLTLRDATGRIVPRDEWERELPPGDVIHVTVEIGEPPFKGYALTEDID